LFSCLFEANSSISDAQLSNSKQSQNLPGPSNVKIRLKPMPTSSQTKKDPKVVSSSKTTKSIEQKIIKKYEDNLVITSFSKTKKTRYFRSTITPKESSVTPKKPTTTTVMPKKLIKTPVTKPVVETKNSDKPTNRSSSNTPSKSVEKKSSDTSISITTTATVKKSIETPSPKLPPVPLGKIPKLNPASKQKVDLLSSNNDSLNTPLPPQRSNLLNNLNPPRSLSPMDLVESSDNLPSKEPTSTRFSSRANLIHFENPQSQSPLSPVRTKKKPSFFLNSTIHHR